MSKQSQVYTIRNKAGQYLGNFRAFSEKEAISKMIATQAQTAATFRRSQPMTVKADDFVAKVES